MVSSDVQDLARNDNQPNENASVKNFNDQLGSQFTHIKKYDTAADKYSKASIELSPGRFVRRDVSMKIMLRTLKKYLRSKYDKVTQVNEIPKKYWSRTFVEDVTEIPQSLFENP